MTKQEPNTKQTCPSFLFPLEALRVKPNRITKTQITHAPIHPVRIGIPPSVLAIMLCDVSTEIYFTSGGTLP